MASSLRRDDSGATFVEFAVVFPILMFFVLGAVDVSPADGQLDAATIAPPMPGARFAAISNPVATGINTTIAGGTAGNSCINPNTGASTGNCTARSATTCIATGATTGSCTNSYTFDNAALDAIVAKMKEVMIEGTLDRRQVSVTYTPITMGYVGRPDGFPMNITVAIRCVRHRFYFMQGLMRWTFPALTGTCAGIPVPEGITLPDFATTMPSEDLTSN